MTRFSKLSALALAAAFALIGTTAFAGSDEAELSAPLTTASAAATATTPAVGRTRAEVIAEMQVARARGELEAGHQWGIDVPQVQSVPAKLQQTATSR